MNFSLSSALECACAAALVLALGCGNDDGSEAYRKGLEAYAVRDLKKAEHLMTDSLAAMPNDVDRLVSLARVKLDLGELAAAKDLVARAALNSSGDSDVALLEAQIAWHAKDYKTASAAYAALANDTARPPAIRAQGWVGLGVVEMACDNYHFARIAFLQAIRQDRRNASAWYHLGLLYRDNFGYREAALEQFEFFVRLEALANPRVQNVQRTVIPELKDYINRSLMERPNAAKRNSSACASLLGKAEAAAKKGVYKNARALYAEALSTDPLSYPAAFGLAQAWERSDASTAGQMKALDYYRQACSLRPGHVRTYLTTGALATKLGMNAQAVEIYSRAVAANAMSPEALDGLIRSLRKVGNKNSIAQAYQRYRDSLGAKRK